MRIIIEEDKNLTETEITVRCHEMTAALAEAISQIGLADHVYAGRRGEETFFVPLREIYCFEVVEGKLFFYTEKDIYESAVRLYKVEENIEGTSFARISKTMIANLKKMRSIKPIENSRLIATMTNGESLSFPGSTFPRSRKNWGCEYEKTVF